MAFYMSDFMEEMWELNAEFRKDMRTRSVTSKVGSSCACSPALPQNDETDVVTVASGFYRDLGEALLDGGKPSECGACGLDTTTRTVVTHLGKAGIRFAFGLDPQPPPCTFHLPLRPCFALNGMPMVARETPSELDAEHDLVSLSIFIGPAKGEELQEYPTERVLVRRLEPQGPSEGESRWELVGEGGLLRTLTEQEMEAFLLDVSFASLGPLMPARPEPVLLLEKATYARRHALATRKEPVEVGLPRSLKGLPALPGADAGAFGSLRCGQFKGARIVLKEMDGALWPNWKEAAVLMAIKNKPASSSSVGSRFVEVRGLFLTFGGEGDCRLHLALERAGESLEKVLSVLDPASKSEMLKGLRAFFAAATALHDLHARSYANLDFKSANIVVMPDSLQYKLIDLGFAVELGRDGVGWSRCHGTVGFRAPELLPDIAAHARPSDHDNAAWARAICDASAVSLRPVTTAADIYSFGAAIFTWLTKKLMAEDAGAEWRRGKGLEAQPVELLASSTAPEELQSLVRLCLQRDPEQRPSLRDLGTRLLTIIGAMDAALCVLPNTTPIVRLNASASWAALTEKERLYAHHLCRASFEGSLIVLLQTSPESPLIHALFQRIFRAQDPDALRKVAAGAGLSDDEFDAALVYLAGFSANMGNYRGSRGTKFFPGLSKEKMDALVKASAAWAADAEGLGALWAEVGDAIFDPAKHRRRLGFGAKKDGKGALTTYLSKSVTQEDVELVDRFMAAEGLEAWNTRLFKSEKDGKTAFEIRFAGIEKKSLVPTKEFEGALIEVSTGDYSPLLKRVIAHLNAAKEHAANAEESAMLVKYAESFTSGSLQAHKDGSRHWVRDVGPVVESYIGFIHNYRDPAGTRSEFEGFVAAVHKATSAKFARLVSSAEDLLTRLPWGPTYEKDRFLKPDFTSLDIIGMGGSGIPAGINIPNYDDIRQNEGFKNVSFGNVISATSALKLNFLSVADDAAFRKWHSASFEVQVGLSELLGHGSGKLFIRTEDGSLNFDQDNVTDLLSGEKISSWYEEGETWGSKFGDLATAYEECRARAVGYVLCCHADVLEIFGFTGAEADEIKYVNWLSEIRAGLLGLEFYSPESQSWRKAHCYARYVLTMVSIEAAQDFVEIEEMTGEDGKPDLRFSLDRTKIDSVGKPATELFLKKLQLYKSTGDVKKGRELFESYGTPTKETLRWREICVARRQPLHIFVQPNTKVSGSTVELVEYAETAGGVVESHVARYDEGTEAELLTLATADKAHFIY